MTICALRRTERYCIYNAVCRNGEAERVNIQLAERFKALDGDECPHKWSDNA